MNLDEVVQVVERSLPGSIMATLVEEFSIDHRDVPEIPLHVSDTGGVSLELSAWSWPLGRVHHCEIQTDSASAAAIGLWLLSTVFQTPSGETERVLVCGAHQSALDKPMLAGLRARVIRDSSGPTGVVWRPTSFEWVPISVREACEDAAEAPVALSFTIETEDDRQWLVIEGTPNSLVGLAAFFFAYANDPHQNYEYLSGPYGGAFDGENVSIGCRVARPGLRK